MKVGLLVARACDQYVSQQNASFPEGRLEAILSRSGNPKGRLLHYYPPETDEPSQNWCAQHTDHGSLTGTLKLCPHHFLQRLIISSGLRLMLS